MTTIQMIKKDIYCSLAFGYSFSRIILRDLHLNPCRTSWFLSCVMHGTPCIYGENWECRTRFHWKILIWFRFLEIKHQVLEPNSVVREELTLLMATVLSLPASRASYQVCLAKSCSLKPCTFIHRFLQITGKSSTWIMSNTCIKMASLQL